MSLGGGARVTGKDTVLSPNNVGAGGVEAPGVRPDHAREAVTAPTLDSASTKWMRHYVINDCPHCWVGDTAEQSHFCAKGQRLREAALAEFRAIPPPPKKRPADTSFNPSIESQGR